MPNQRLFDSRHGKRAFVRLRSMLNNPRLTYHQIGSKFGLPRQRIARIATELAISGKQRQRERLSRRGPRIRFKEYPSGIRAVINKIRRAGLRVTPYNSPQRTVPNLVRTSLRMILVNDVLCTLQIRRAYQLKPNGREYVRFDVTAAIKRAKIALWALRNGRTTKLYIIPVTRLHSVPWVLMPLERKYNSNKPLKDLSRYKEAWHLLGRPGNHPHDNRR
jgi:hypothetical protein